MKDIAINVDKFKDIINVMEGNEGVKLSVSMPILKNSITISSDDLETMLHIRKSKMRYEISNVAFKNKRQGSMSLVLDKLKAIAKQEGVGEIMVGFVQSEEMYRFCIKHGFRKIEGDFEIEGYPFVGDYILTL